LLELHSLYGNLNTNQRNNALMTEFPEINLPRRISPQDDGLPQVLDLLWRSFGFMDGRIDPPSSLHRLTLDRLATQEVWGIGSPVVACVVLTPREGCLYLGKLAVDTAFRGGGLARVLVDLAVARAQELQLPVVQLQTRVELVENRAAFERMGFHVVRGEAHPGYDRVTSWVLERVVAPSKHIH
jgi:GNAT superfamily N-acetyltransferase